MDYMPKKKRPSRPPNHRAQERIVVALWALQDACCDWRKVATHPGHDSYWLPTCDD